MKGKIYSINFNNKFHYKPINSKKCDDLIYWTFPEAKDEINNLAKYLTSIKCVSS